LIRKVTKKYLRIAYRKCTGYVRRYTSKVRYGYVYRKGFSWKWRRFSFGLKSRTFIKRIKCVALRKVVKKSIKKLVKRVRKTIRKYKLKLVKFLSKYVLTKRTRKLIHKRIHKILK